MSLDKQRTKELMLAIAKSGDLNLISAVGAKVEALFRENYQVGNDKTLDAMLSGEGNYELEFRSIRDLDSGLDEVGNISFESRDGLLGFHLITTGNTNFLTVKYIDEGRSTVVGSKIEIWGVTTRELPVHKLYEGIIDDDGEFEVTLNQDGEGALEAGMRFIESIRLRGKVKIIKS